MCLDEFHIKLFIAIIIHKSRAPGEKAMSSDIRCINMEWISLDEYRVIDVLNSLTQEEMVVAALEGLKKRSGKSMEKNPSASCRTEQYISEN